MRRDTQLMNIYETLLAHYGDPDWWPAGTPYEVMVGAVLTQNTAWVNVEKAIKNFGSRLQPHCLAEMPLDELKAIIRPAGFFNQKANYLKDLTAWFARYAYDVRQVQREPLDHLRRELLQVRGVGPETADSILLYAFERPSFVVDAYTRRLCTRHPLNTGTRYLEIKSYFEQHIPRDTQIYNNYHALIVLNGKHHCQKKSRCAGCPLTSSCSRLTGTNSESSW